MNKNKKKNIAILIASAFLFLALFDGWEYGFFTMLRFVVFAATAYVAWLAYEEQRVKWVWIFGGVAVLFNPFFPVYLERETWLIIDSLVGLCLLGVMFFFKLESNSTDNHVQ